MAAEGASPPKGSRTRVYSVVLIVVTVSVVTLAVLLPVLLNRVPLPPSPPTAGANQQLDSYAPGSAMAGQYGDDPTLAVAPNGTIAVAWEGLDELAPPSGRTGLPVFSTAIFVSFSNDGGRSFSAPRYVGSPGTVSALLPTLAYASNGTLFVAYENSTNSVNQAILVASATPGQNFTPGIAAIRGQDLGRPWLFVLPNGNVALVFGYAGLVEWELSVDGGRSFQAPTILLQGILTGAVQWEGDEVTLVGLSTGALTYTTVSIWSVSFNATGTGNANLGTAATIQIPYPDSVSMPNLSRPGPAVGWADGVLYLYYSNTSEGQLTLQTSTTNGTTWAGPWKLWTPGNVTVEMPVAATSSDGTYVALGWESTQGGFWRADAAIYDLRTGLMSSPTVVSDANGFPASVRDWHGSAMGVAITGTTHFIEVWGDGRGLSGTYGLTHIYAATLTGQL